MHHQVHLVIATSCSMIVTFILHYINQFIPPRNSVLQRYVIDFYHRTYLIIHCMCNRGINDTTCSYFTIQSDLYDRGVFLFGFLLLCVLILCLNKKVTSHIPSIIVSWFAIEHVAYYVAFMNLWYKIDVLTVYLFVWQLSSLGMNWIQLKLLPPIRIIEQGSSWIISALIAWIIDFTFFRYFPRDIRLIGLWLLSLYDVYACLHYHGDFYYPCLAERRRPGRTTPVAGMYYINGIDKWKRSASLGFADFRIYNILILLAMPQSSSLIVKICVTFGSIVSVQISRLIAYKLQWHAKVLVGPGVPLPVIMISIYIFFLDIIMPNFNACFEL